MKLFKVNFRIKELKNKGIYTHAHIRERWEVLKCHAARSEKRASKCASSKDSILDLRKSI